jgi:hypothetical protein
MDLFEDEYNEVVEGESAISERIKGKYPFTKSAWKSTYISCINQKETHGDLLRSTFLSGGSMHMPFVMYHESLRIKALDIEKQVILTDAEVAHNCEGIRLFFELDYRTTSIPLPAIETVMIHANIIYQTVFDCFPSMDNIVMHMAMCQKKRKQKRSESKIALAWGLHVIFPDIVVTTSIMKLISQLLDIRISKIDPTWSNVVDGASYRSNSATLRPCFSYKMITCPICVRDDEENIKTTKRKRKDASYDLENLFRIELSATCHCFNGRVVDPSYYDYIGSICHIGGDIVQLLEGVLNVLSETSIVPLHMGMFTDGFTRTEDMGDELDIIPGKKDNILFPAERRAISGFQRRKTLENIIHKDFPSGIHLLRGVLGRIHENYVHLGVHTVCLDRNKKLFIVTVKGKGSRFCPYKGNHHHSNRVYFCINFGRQRVNIHCFDNDCKKKYGTKPIARTMSIGDCINIEKEFGLPVTIQRRSISPITSVTSNPTPEVANNARREEWEERRKKFLSTQTHMLHNKAN